ncbi:MAG: RagB/SusD family nutrient uptake outer membrane protein [Gemmatimonas sp.]|nr:RagB/SusD family nutrient uptake outer membrane protein [Gemmatimonas sp.]
MSKATRRAERVRRFALVAALLLSGTACKDFLQVDNLMMPDRERATSNPEDLEALIGGIFYPTFYNAWNEGTHATNLWPPAASEQTATLNSTGDFQFAFELQEPRRAHDNTTDISAGAGPHGPRNFWSGVGNAATQAYNGLIALNEGAVIMDGDVDVTDRAWAYALFMRGWTWGYGGLVFDRFHILPETTPLPADPAALRDLTLSSLRPYPEVIEAAVASLEEAIEVAQQNPSVVRFPTLSESPLWFGTATPVSNTQFIQMANTLAARLLVLSARTPAERAQLDWARVRRFTQNGLTEDFEVQRTAQRTSLYLLRIQNNDPSYTSNQRLDYRMIGLADQSGAYQNWINSPIQDRTRFDIVTPDRRITGPQGPTSGGAYTRYRVDNNGFALDRGAYLFSAYQWARHAKRNNLEGDGLVDTGAQSGVHPHITVDENNLLAAEAEYYLGNRAAAAELVNITRQRSHTIDGVEYPGLPPVTAAGVPMVDGQCVPRTDFTGECGDLLTAIRYERMLELTGLDPIRGYADSRGFGILADGSLLQWPVPGNVLELYDVEYYTYGGVGTEFGAAFAPVTGP